MESQRYAYLMGPLSCVAAQIVRFTDEPAVLISWVPSGFFGAGGATGNNKTNLRSSQVK